jgi:rubrerythrin
VQQVYPAQKRKMTVQLNAFEIFDIAMQIEQNGSRFYNKAAEIFDDPEARKMFLRLAEWEIKHEQTFSSMRKQLSESNQEPGTFKPEQKLPVPKAMAGLAVFGIKSEPTDELKGTESQDEILRRAIEKEEDSIIFYDGLMDFIPIKADKDKIDDIIKEEMQHIRILNRLRKRKE